MSKFVLKTTHDEKKEQKNFGKKISNQQWLILKPYDGLTSYDRYYIGQAEKVYDIQRAQKNWFNAFDFSSKEFGDLACILISYFEDFINEIGIWQFFQQKNKELFDCLVGENTLHFVTNYLLENYPTHNIKFPIASSKINMLREINFLMRFYNSNDFREPIPSTRHTVS